MLLVDTMPTRDIPKRVDTCLPMQWSGASTSTSTGPAASASIPPLSGAQQLSDMLEQLQYTAWRSPGPSAGALGAGIAPGVGPHLMADTRVAQSELPATSLGATAHGNLDAMLDAWEVSFLEELSKGDLAIPSTCAQTLPPAVTINQATPFKVAASMPFEMPMVEQELARATWTSISDPQTAVAPIHVATQVLASVSSPEMGSPSGSQSAARSGGGRSDSSAKTGKLRTAAQTLKKTTARKGEGKAVRDEAARARNARNQQLHRMRQKEKLEAGERKCRELQDQIRQLNIVNAGLRAHNEALQVGEQERPTTEAAAQDQGLPGDMLWQLPGSNSLPNEAHVKLAAVFDCISQGMGKGPITPADVALMSPEDIFLIRQQYGAYLGQLLNSGAAEESSDMHRQLVRVVSLWADSEACLWRQCPKTVHRFAAFAEQQEQRKHSVPSALKWSTILGQLGLSEVQKVQLRQAHKRLADQLLNVTAERFHVSAMLQDTCPDAQKGNTWQGSNTYLRLLEANKRLSASIRHEHDHMLHAHMAFRQITTPLQQALCDVMAHPGTLDIIAIFNVLSGQSTSQLQGL